MAIAECSQLNAPEQFKHFIRTRSLHYMAGKVRVCGRHR